MSLYFAPVFFTFVVGLESYARQSSPESWLRPTNLLHDLTYLIGAITAFLGEKLAQISDLANLLNNLWRWINDFALVLKELCIKYLPFEDVRNLLNALVDFLCEPWSRFVQAYQNYYMSRELVWGLWGTFFFFTLLFGILAYRDGSLQKLFEPKGRAKASL